MVIGELVLELLKGEDARCLNALSLASSGIHNTSEIHMYARLSKGSILKDPQNWGVVEYGTLECK